MSKMDSIYQWVADESAKAAGEWYRLQCANVYGAYYLYFRLGELKVASAVTPTGFELASGERLRVNATPAQQAAWIETLARKLPILPEVLTGGAK